MVAAEEKEEQLNRLKESSELAQNQAKAKLLSLEASQTIIKNEKHSLSRQVKEMEEAIASKNSLVRCADRPS